MIIPSIESVPVLPSQPAALVLAVQSGVKKGAFNSDKNSQIVHASYKLTS